MRALSLSNARCFVKIDRARIAPLTILVGENSTGKSSFLALYRIANDILNGSLKPNFNLEPFFLGAFDQIAYVGGGKIGRAQQFSISTSVDVPQQNKRPNDTSLKAELKTTFVKVGSQPSIAKVVFSAGPFEMTLTPGEPPRLMLDLPSWKGTVPEELLNFMPIRNSGFFEPRMLAYMLGHERAFVKNLPPLWDESDQKTIQDELNALASLWDAFKNGAGGGGAVFGMAPVRMKPERTYNPIDEARRPEGGHIPMLLAKTKFGDRRKWEQMIAVLNEFGKDSGLFQQLGLRTFGNDSDPFQIMVKINGPSSNLMDVGYGVSQVLPILVDLIEGRRGRTFLMQQPEVHLHPRGQAAMGTFLSNYIKSNDGSVIVETHSDYLIDRVRMEIRSKKIKADDVSILYFERSGRNVKIHSIELDDFGNILNAPKGYRSFFFEEENRLFGVDDVHHH